MKIGKSGMSKVIVDGKVMMARCSHKFEAYSSIHKNGTRTTHKCVHCGHLLCKVEPCAGCVYESAEVGCWNPAVAEGTAPVDCSRKTVSDREGYPRLASTGERVRIADGTTIAERYALRFPERVGKERLPVAGADGLIHWVLVDKA